ncbi:PfkB family carbohydrate kinase [Candidatus Bipolaricaulota bacterium]
MGEHEFDVCLIGHFAVDKIVTVDGQSRSAHGGAVYYGGLNLARQGYRVAVVTRLHRDDFWRLDEIRDAGIEVFAAEAPESAGMENIYLSEDRDKRICKSLGFAGPFTAEELPEISAQLQLIIPIQAGEVDLPALKIIAKRGPVGLDVQGFVRFAEGDDIVFHDWPDKADGLQYVHYLKADDTEAEVLTGLTDLRAAARALAALGPKEVLITHKRGVLVYVDESFYTGDFTPKKMMGRTGRGDTCFTTYCARRLSMGPAEACAYAAAVTSLKLETQGPFNRTIQEVEEKLSE